MDRTSAKRILYRAAAFALTSIISLSFMACGARPVPAAKETRSFTDSAGRTVGLPDRIDRVAVSGTVAQIAVFALCPDKLVGLAGAWDDAAKPYIGEKYRALPVLGQLYGGKGELNLETLLASGAQAVIDIGEPKQGIAEELDALQEQTGIPFVHITLRLEAMGDMYRKLGELMDMPAEAETLAEYCERTYARAKEIASSADKTRLLCIAGNEGIHVLAKASCHAEVIDMMADNIAVVDVPSANGTGNETDIEQLMKWDPDVILYAPDSTYVSAGDDPLMRNVPAIKSGRYYEVPGRPYGWLGSPPSVQRLLGMLWLAKLLYPELADYDLCEEVKTYFRLFFHCELTEEQYGALVVNSTGKAD